VHQFQNLLQESQQKSGRFPKERSLSMNRYLKCQHDCFVQPVVFLKTGKRLRSFASGSDKSTGPSRVEKMFFIEHNSIKENGSREGLSLRCRASCWNIKAPI